MLKKPVIGISANYSRNDDVGKITDLGLPEQEWQLLPDDYIVAISQAGGIPIILPIIENNENLKQVISLCDGILLSGGSDIDPQHYNENPIYGLGSIEPKRDQYDLKLAKTVLETSDIPVLGVCRGCQLLNVVTGGTIYQDIQKQMPNGINHTIKDAPKHHPTHKVNLKKGSILSEIFQQETIGVNSFNHQGIKELGKGFEATMTAPDGLIEGIEYQSQSDRFVVAVQWHPEMMIEHEERYLKLFSHFVSQC